MTKGAVLQLARSIAVEYRDQGIRCNAVCPGFVKTNHGLNEIKQLEKTGVVFKTGDRLKLKGFAIFGTCFGMKNNKVLFNDEETHEIRYYNINKVEKSYDKWR